MNFDEFIYFYHFLDVSIVGPVSVVALSTMATIVWSGANSPTVEDYHVSISPDDTAIIDFAPRSGMNLFTPSSYQGTRPFPRTKSLYNQFSSTSFLYVSKISVIFTRIPKSTKGGLPVYSLNLP